MFDRIKNTLRVAVKEWRTGEQGHRRYTEVMAEREAARQAAFASLSATAKDTAVASWQWRKNETSCSVSNDE